MVRILQRAKHLLQRIGNECKSFPKIKKTYGLKVASATFKDGLIPPENPKNIFLQYKNMLIKNCHLLLTHIIQIHQNIIMNQRQKLILVKKKCLFGAVGGKA